ncbi:MAG: LamG domain-containing protein, partial [Sedimentisphaerales bacterium]|nr:LamG domain-containing protein [Sedimentisphaerales bacterium]
MFRKMIYLSSFVLVLCLVLTSIAECADPSLVAWYRFDGNALDSSGNEIHGTEMGDPTYEPGVFGQAISLDGDGDYVDCGLDPKLDITEFLTFTYWIKVNAFDKQWNTVISRGDDSWRSSRADLNPFMEAAVGGTAGNYLYGVTPVDDGEWHHVGWVYDGTMSYLYVDGEVDATEENSGQITVSSYPLYIGDNSQATGRFWNGLIDDVQIYNRPLTQDEIQIVMQSSAGDYPQAAGPVPSDGALHADTWVNMAWWAGDFAVSHDVYFGDNFDDVDAGTESTFQGNQTSTFLVAGFPGFAFPDGLVPGTTYYWRVDEVNDAEPNSPWKGDVWSFSIPPKTAYFPDPADGAESVGVDDSLSWTAGFGAKLHTVYFGESFEEVDNAAGGLPQGTLTYNPGALKMAKTYYWRVDEFDIIETYKGDVWSFTTEGAVGSPSPANGAVDITQTPVLTWTPGLGASHEVYFGADAGSLENKGGGNLGSESYQPGQLEWNTTYYWRVDEANNANPDSPWIGPLWSFTTADFLIIDDMESYNDLDEGQPGSNRIY